MSDEKQEPTKHLWVNGVVAVRDEQPYIQISTERGMVAQLSLADARQFANDIVVQASRTEMDAMLLRFLKEEMKVNQGAYNAMMMAFREYRNDLDSAENRARSDRPPEENK